MDHKPRTAAQEKELVMIWKRAAPFLEEQRERDIRASDTARDIDVFDGLIEDAIARFPPKPNSGFVEMKRYFQKLPAKPGDPCERPR